jgi:hypothetical protein
MALMRGVCMPVVEEVAVPLVVDRGVPAVLGVVVVIVGIVSLMVRHWRQPPAFTVASASFRLDEAARVTVCRWLAVRLSRTCNNAPARRVVAGTRGPARIPAGRTGCGTRGWSGR